MYLFLNGPFNNGHTKFLQWRLLSLVRFASILTPVNNEGQTVRLILINFKKLTTFFFFDLKTCFDVANIIVSYKIFEKPLELYNN